MKSLVFTCPKLAKTLIINTLVSIIFCVVAILINKILIFSIPFIILFLALLPSITLYEFSFAVFRSLILVKLDNEGIKNAFCKIKYDEITNIGYECLEFKAPRRRGYVEKYSLVIIVNGKDKTFRSYDKKTAICIPLNEKTKKAFIEYAPQVAEKFNICL